MRRKLVLLILLSVGLSAFSQTKAIKDLENQRKKALIEIETTNKLLRTTKVNTNTLLDRIKLLSKQINSRQEVVSLLNKEVENITLEHIKTEKEIKRLSVKLDQKRGNYALAIKGMIRKKQNKNKLLFVLSGKSMSESLRRMKYLKDYSEWRNRQADEIIKDSHDLEEKKLDLEKRRKEKLNLLAERRAEQKKLKEEETVQQGEVKKANEKQKELQEIIRKKQQQANALNAQIEKLIAEEVARQEREAKRIAAEKAKANAANKPKTPAEERSPATTQENITLSNSFVTNKGRFPMPVTGRYTIVGRFGAQQHQWNVTTESNGIDIQTQAGSEARSIFQGEVTVVGAFPGYNNYVIVRHGGYYTFYGNIQQVSVKIGQKVETGQSLGRIYTDIDTGRSQMHFQLWKGTTKLNPEPWLRK
ncbi:murein hydrolase activator EnvC family protein [Viscerimonas tarda]